MMTWPLENRQSEYKVWSLLLSLESCFRYRLGFRNAFTWLPEAGGKAARQVKACWASHNFIFCDDDDGVCVCVCVFVCVCVGRCVCVCVRVCFVLLVNASVRWQKRDVAKTYFLAENIYSFCAWGGEYTETPHKRPCSSWLWWGILLLLGNAGVEKRLDRGMGGGGGREGERERERELDFSRIVV